MASKRIRRLERQVRVLNDKLNAVVAAFGGRFVTLPYTPMPPPPPPPIEKPNGDPEDVEPPLYRLIRDRQLNEAKRYIAAGADVNMKRKGVGTNTLLEENWMSDDVVGVLLVAGAIVTEKFLSTTCGNTYCAKSARHALTLRAQHAPNIDYTRILFESYLRIKTHVETWPLLIECGARPFGELRRKAIEAGDLKSLKVFCPEDTVCQTLVHIALTTEHGSDALDAWCVTRCEVGAPYLLFDTFLHYGWFPKAEHSVTREWKQQQLQIADTALEALREAFECHEPGIFVMIKSFLWCDWPVF